MLHGPLSTLFHSFMQEHLLDMLYTQLIKLLLMIFFNTFVLMFQNGFIYRVLTIHGSMDKIVLVEDAYEFDKFIPNHKLCIVEGADHEYTSHQDELASIVLDFSKNDHFHQSGNNGDNFVRSCL